MKQPSDLKTIDGLLGHLADTMLRLESRKITVDDAKAQASLVKQSNNLLRFELDKAKFEHKLSTPNAE
jgi:hypothetical protein